MNSKKATPRIFRPLSIVPEDAESSASSSTWNERPDWVPAGYSISLLSGTNSTVSSILGPGRTVGRLLSRAGSRLEPILSRAAERLGRGPKPAVRRLMAVFLSLHRLQGNRQCLLQITTLSISVDTIVQLSCFQCSACGERFSLEIHEHQRNQCREFLNQLLAYVRSTTHDFG